MNLTLPYPPSVNRLYRVFRNRILLSRDGRASYKAVAECLGSMPVMRGPLAVTVVATPPDRRRRDLSNLLKALEDSLTKCGAWEDDSQIVRYDGLRWSGEYRKPGNVCMTIEHA